LVFNGSIDPVEAALFAIGVLSLILSLIRFKKEYPPEQTRRLMSVERKVVSLEERQNRVDIMLEVVRNDISWMRQTAAEHLKAVENLEQRLNRLIEDRQSG
jgi:hypothetical protein